MKQKPKYQSNNDNDIVWIASMDGLDKPLHKMVEEVLAKAGIKYSIEGSILYGLAVYRKDINTAVKALKADIRLEGNKIRFSKKPSKVPVGPGAYL